ncbi:unnamed protein product [Pieris brassicae]|uniref:Uncharacterized protein n=1 Tax=Pieris brassicae TaxID=7116 RepID=A0A9P0SLS1_PIEBR|nr:unnamed protein product [Pieris brassicae]
MQRESKETLRDWQHLKVIQVMKGPSDHLHHRDGHFHWTLLVFITIYCNKRSAIKKSLEANYSRQILLYSCKLREYKTCRAGANEPLTTLHHKALALRDMLDQTT